MTHESSIVYDTGPLIEVVSGVSFPSIERFCTVHVGRFGESVRSEYPTVQDAQPLAPSPPLPRTQGAAGPALRHTTGLPPLRRAFFLNTSGDGLIQVQSDRFLYNWRKLDTVQAYPRLPTVTDELQKRFRQFREFCVKEDLAPPAPESLELTYVNHVPSGSLWQSVGDLGQVFPWLAFGPPGLRKLAPETFAASLRFPAPDAFGWASLELKQGQLIKEQRDVIILEVTVRGSPEEPSDMAVSDWFSRARRVANHVFDTATSDVAHRAWGRREVAA